MSDWKPATEAEAAMQAALAASDQEHYFRILARSELLLPVSAEALAGRAPLGWGTWTTGNRTHVLAFTSPVALATCLSDPSASYRTVSFPGLAADWPNYEWWLAVNPGLPIEAYLPSWFISQLVRGDVRLPGRTTARSRMGSGDLAAAIGGRRRASTPGADGMPTQPTAEVAAARNGKYGDGPYGDGPYGDGPYGDGTVIAETIDAEIIDYPPASGSAPVYAGGYAADGAGPGPTGFPIAEPGIAPGTRVTPDAGFSTGTEFVAQGRVPAASAARAAVQAEDAEIVVPPRLREAGFVPANETEANLFAAAGQNDTDAFLSTLLLARVVVPVPPGTPSTARPRDRNFPWQIDEADGKRFIAVFTSPERLAEHGRFGSSPATVSSRFVQLIAAWPDADVAFAINPGSPVGATLPGSQIVALAAWATEVGLRDDPTADIAVAPKRIEPGSAKGVAGAPTGAAERATVMQRAVPPAQLAFYLDRGYDRVSGFVNRASEVAHLTSPQALYRALGLVYPGSPFSEDDTEVHVLRWVAHRTDLYRLPYGGQHEAAMRAMQGWVIERAPFRGNSFAPGDTDVIAEFKVDSVRLPHGAQMWRLSADGTETLVATFDADTTKWIRASGGPAGHGGSGHA